MEIQEAIKDLCAYSVKAGLIEEGDIIWALNTIIRELGIDAVDATREDVLQGSGQHSL